MVGTATVVANSLINTAGCKAKAGGTTAAAATNAATPEQVDALVSALGECMRTGEMCLTHALRLFIRGDVSLGPCAKQVREMLAVCHTTQTLALADSKQLPTAAKLCADTCAECAAECEKHAAMHPICAATAASCKQAAAAARAVASA